MTTALRQTGHPGELALRRLQAQEAVGEDVAHHVAACEACRARVQGFRDEQRQFEAAIPFERFAAGVERASRTPRDVAPRRPHRLTQGFLALAATVLVTVGVSQLVGLDGARGGNRLKGGAGIELVVAPRGGGPQRAAADHAAEPLAPGDRVRVGVTPGPWRYVAVVSVDERGEVSALYPESGPSLPLGQGDAQRFLPDSLEFTGQGLERVIVVLTREPIGVEQLVQSARLRFGAARGGLDAMGPLDVPGEQFQRTFQKP